MAKNKTTDAKGAPQKQQSAYARILDMVQQGSGNIARKPQRSAYERMSELAGRRTETMPSASATDVKPQSAYQRMRELAGRNGNNVRSDQGIAPYGEQRQSAYERMKELAGRSGTAEPAAEAREPLNQYQRALRAVERDARDYGRQQEQAAKEDPAYSLALRFSAEELQKKLETAQGAAKSAQGSFEHRRLTENVGLYNNSPESAKAAQERLSAAHRSYQDKSAEVERLQDALAMRKRMDAQAKRGTYEQQILNSQGFSDELAQRGLLYIRNRIDESREAYKGKIDVPESALYQDYMTEDEKRVFGYLTAMDMHDAQFPASGVHYEEWKPGSRSWYNGMYAGGRSAAYIQSIHDELIDRIYEAKARERFVPKKGAGLAEIGSKVLDYTAASLNEGIGRGVEGLVNAFNPNYKGYDTPQQRLLGYAQAANERDYGDTLRGRLYRDLGGAAQSIGQMLPAMTAGYGAGTLVGTLGTGVAGTDALSATNVGTTAAMASTAAQRAAFFLSIKGNAYAEAREKGMTEAQAQTYSMINALSETSLESLIGGVAGFGGISAQELGLRANQIRSTLGRIAAHVGLNYAGELVEENLQDVIDPIVLSMITGKKQDMPTLSDLLDTSIATIMMVSGTNAVETGKYAYQTKVRSNLLKIAEQAQELAKNDAAYQRLSDNVRNFVDEVDRNPDTMKFTKQDTLAALSWKTWLDLSKDGGQNAQNVQQNAQDDQQNVAADSRRYGDAGRDNGLGVNPEFRQDDKHTAQEAHIIQEYANAIDPSIVSFADRVRRLNSQSYKAKQIHKISSVSDRQAADVQRETGVDARGYQNAISGTTISHIDNRHGKNGKADQSMSNTDDIARIGYVIDNYDTIRLLTNKNGDPILSAEWVNSDGTHAKQIELTKKIDGTYYVIEAAIDTQKKTLMVTSAYMNQKGSAAQSLNMEQSPPQLTSQTPNGSNASVPNISQGKAQVNTEFDNGLGVNPEFRQDAEAKRDAAAAQKSVPYEVESPQFAEIEAMMYDAAVEEAGNYGAERIEREIRDAEDALKKAVSGSDTEAILRGRIRGMTDALNERNGAETGNSSSALRAPSPQGEGMDNGLGVNPEFRADTNANYNANNNASGETETGRRTENYGIKQAAEENAAATAAQAETAGASREENRVALLDGGRNLGQREGAAGIPAEVRNKGRTKEQRQIAAQRADAASGSPLRSSADYLRNGTDAELLHELPEERWDDEVIASVNYARANGASRVTVVTGLLQVSDGGSTANPVAAVNLDTGEIVVRGDSMQQSVSEAILHEVGHLNATTAVVRAFSAAVQKNVHTLAWQTVYTAYEKKYAGFTGNYAGMTEQEKNDYIWEEILCDANAGLDKFGVRAYGMQNYAREAFLVSGSDTEGAGTEAGVRFASEDDEKTENERFEYMKPFNEQIQDFMDKEKRRAIFGKNGILVGTTPKILQDIGLIKMPVGIEQKYVSFALDGTYNRHSKHPEYVQDHIFSPEEFAKLPEKLADPIAVIADLKYNKPIVFVEMNNKGGKQTIVPYSIGSELRIGGQRINLQQVDTVHGNTEAENMLRAAILGDSDERVRLYYLNAEKIPSRVRQAAQVRGGPIPNGIIHRITDKGSVVKPAFSSIFDTIQFRRWFGKSKVTNADGTPRMVYHQTAKDFWEFNTDNPVAGRNDSETPNGIFFKDNDHDIGIGGDRQMACYLSVQNPLHFADRKEANQWYQKHIQGYAALQSEMQRKLKPFDDELQKIEDAMFADDVSTEEYDALEKQWDAKLEEMRVVEDEYRGRLRDLLNQYFISGNSGYDGIILDYDGHRYVNGTRENVKTYIVFQNTQVKSATDNIGTFDRNNPDTRYSLDAEEDDFGNGLGVDPEFRQDVAADSRRYGDGGRDNGLGVDSRFRDVPEYQPGMNREKRDNGLGVTGPGFADTGDTSSALRAPSPQGEGRDNGLDVTGPGFVEPKSAGGIDRRTAQTLRQRRQSRETGVTGAGAQTERSAALARQGMPNTAETQQGAQDVPEEYGTSALQTLGVKVQSSVGNFYAVKQLLEANRAAKSVQRELKKAEKRMNATAKEKDFASGVAAGIYGMEDLPKTVDADRVMELADYYLAERAVKGNQIRQRKQDIKRDLDAQMTELFKDADEGKEGKKRFSPPRNQAMVVLNNRTPARNMRTIFGDERGERIYQEVFVPVEENEAERYRFINRMYDKVRTFTDSRGKQSKLTKAERAIAQMLLEGKDAGQIAAASEMADVIEKAAKEIAGGTKADDALFGLGLDAKDRASAIRLSGWLQAQEALKDKKIDVVRVNNAVKAYEQIYAQMYEAINDFLAAHGIEPIGFIPSYAPHIQPEETKTAMQHAFSLLGLNAEVNSLPTAIAGLTADFKPDKRWNPHFLERTGDRTEYDIAKGFEHYVDYISDIFYHTDDVMRVRAASRYFRQTYAPEEIRNNLEAAKELQYLSVAEQAGFLRDKGIISRDSALSAQDVRNMMDEYIDKLYEETGKTSAHGNLVMWLDNYANILTAKQSMADRGWEYSVGRDSLNIGNKLKKIFGQSKIAGNLSSMLNQGAQLPMIYAELGARWTTAALRDVATGKLRRAAWAQESDFLTGKKGVDGLVTDVKDMILDAMFKPAEFMDTLVSTIAVRGKYLEQIHNGASHEEAMRAADTFGAEIMGSRMKGTKPLAFHSKGFFANLINTFQIEALNSWEHLVKDLPRDFRKIQREHGKVKAAAALSGVIVKMLLAAFVLNRLEDELYGGTPAPFDILGLSANFIASGEGLTTNDWLRTIIDNGLEKLGADRLFGTDAAELGDEDFDWSSAIEDTAYNVSNDVPFVRNISAMLGLGDKSLPMPDVYGGIKGVVEAVESKGMSPETGKAVLKLLAELLPGGNQINKTAQGIEVVARGGDYTGYGEGKQLKYPLDEGVLSAARAVLFGKSATNENEAFYASGANKLSAKQTALYEDFVADGLGRKNAYKIINDTRKEYSRINKEDAKASQKATMLASWINAQPYTDDQKTRLRDTFKYYSNIPAEAEAYDKLLDQGVSDADATALVSAFGKLTPEDGKEQISALQKYRAIVDSGMNEQNQIHALAATMTEAEYEKLDAGYNNGITPTMYVNFRETLPSFDQDGNGNFSQEEVKSAINSMRGLSKQQKAVLWQLANKAWKAGNNPFDTSIGRKVYEAMH